MTRRFHRLGQAGLLTLGGVLYFLGFAGFGIWPLALVCFVPVFLAIEREREYSAPEVPPHLGADASPPAALRALEARRVRLRARALPAGRLDADPGAELPGCCTERNRPTRGRHILLWGVFFGLVTDLGGYYWLIGTLERFSGFPSVLCFLLSSVLCAYQGAQLAVFCWFWDRLVERKVHPAVAAAAALGAVETIYPLLFESYLANSFHNLPIVMQIVDLGGPVLLSMVAAAASGALYATYRNWRARARRPWVSLAVVAGLWVAVLGYGAYRIHEVNSRATTAPKLTVGVVQANMGSFEKREDPREGLLRHIDQSIELQQTVHPDLIVWPESAYMFLLPEHVTNVSRLVTGPELHTPVLFGGLARRSVNGHERHYNTAYITDADANIEGTYDKTFLLAFGEYLPLGETFPVLYRWSPHSGRFTPGSHLRPLPLGNHRLATLICYEDILPGFVRTAVSDGHPDLLVNITNDAWFGDTQEPWVHLALSKFRAVEHHRYLVRATNTGVSAIVDATGRVVEASHVFEHESIHGEVAMLADETVFGRFGNWPGWLAFGATAYFAFARRRKSGASTYSAGTSEGVSKSS